MAVHPPFGAHFEREAWLKHAEVALKIIPSTTITQLDVTPNCRKAGIQTEIDVRTPKPFDGG